MSNAGIVDRSYTNTAAITYMVCNKAECWNSSLHCPNVCTYETVQLTNDSADQPSSAPVPLYLHVLALHCQPLLSAHSAAATSSCTRQSNHTYIDNKKLSYRWQTARRDGDVFSCCFTKYSIQKAL